MHKRLFIPGPVEVREHILKELTNFMIGHRTSEFKELFGSLRKGLQDLMCTSNDVLISTSSGSGFMEGAIRNCVSSKVLHCVNGAFSNKWYQISVGCDKQPDRIDVGFGKAVKPEMIEEKLESGDYEAVCVTHCETSTGVLSPIEQISKVMERYPDVLFFVDAVSSLAGAKIEVDKLGIDICLASSQKAIALPPGIAVASISERAYEKASRVKGRGYYFDFLELKKSYDKDQTPYTPSVPHLYALKKQLELMQQEGFDNRFERHKQMSLLTQSWAKKNFEMFSEEGYHSPTVSCISNTKGLDFAKIKSDLNNEDITIDAGYRNLNNKLKEQGKPLTFRIAHMGDLTVDEIKALLERIEQYF